MDAMAIRTVQMIEDDIDGSTGASTVSFSLEGASYEIDLNDHHTDELRQTMQPWIDKARRARTATRGAARRASSSPVSGNGRASSPLKGRTTMLAAKGLSAREVRGWAQQNGVEVNEFGRIPDAVIEQYEAAQGASSVMPEAPAPADESSRPAATKKAPAKKAAAKRGGRKKKEPVTA